jgi:hypothetical protein
MRIERIDMAEPKPLPTPQTMIDAIDWAGTFVFGNDERLARLVVRKWRCRRSSIPMPFRRMANTESDKKRGRAVANMFWKLAPDEALIVEFNSHDGFWMLSNMGTIHEQHGLSVSPRELYTGPQQGGQGWPSAHGAGPRRSGLSQLVGYPRFRARSPDLSQPAKHQCPQISPPNW